VDLGQEAALLAASALPLDCLARRGARRPGHRVFGQATALRSEDPIAQLDAQLVRMNSVQENLLLGHGRGRASVARPIYWITCRSLFRQGEEIGYRHPEVVGNQLRILGPWPTTKLGVLDHGLADTAPTGKRTLR
jgi:hypothetical protein